MPGAAPPGCSLGRWLLLVVVLVGLSGMHVLTAEDAAGGHGMLPATITAHSMTGHDAPGAPTMADQQMVADPVGMVSAPGAVVDPRRGRPDGAAPVELFNGSGGAGHDGLMSCVLFLT